MVDEASVRIAGTAVVLRDGREGPEALLLRRPESGSFPGAWVFPGGRVDAADRADAATEEDAARSAAVRETHEEAGIRIRDLAVLSCWSPPSETPVRFRTWFFLARDRGEEVRINPGEIEEAAWLTVDQVFTRHAAGEIVLFPPTWVTLHGLLLHRTVDDAFTALDAIAAPARFDTRISESAEGRLALWSGDEQYPDEPGAVGARHRLRMGSLPWTYERG
ncbi:NUDIX hydrolase [Microbacterium sp. MAHUQ-60]|uniref:NUDIX hydrolase n=1 Tax=unclassified Microbacterium TaxID=2609290 RepID=UPI0036186F73